MIRRARRGGREARGNEEKERMRKGAIVSSSPQGITSWIKKRLRSITKRFRPSTL